MAHWAVGDFVFMDEDSGITQNQSESINFVIDKKGEGDKQISQTDDSILYNLEPGDDQEIEGFERPEGPIWLKFDGIELRLEEKEILKNRTEWLNDKIMDAAQILMQRQFPYISG